MSWAAQDVGELLKSIGFTEVDSRPLSDRPSFRRWSESGILGTNQVSLGLSFGRFGSLWRTNSTSLIQPSRQSGLQPLKVGNVVLSDLSPALDGPDSPGGCDILLGSETLSRYSAMFMPAVGRLFFRETPLSEKMADELEGVWQRSGFQKHTLLRVGDDMMIQGELQSRPVGFFVRPQLEPTFLDVNAALNLGMIPKPFPKPNPRYRPKGWKESEEETHQGLDIWKRYVEVDQFAFGAFTLRPGKRMVSDRVFPSRPSDANGIPVVGLIGHDMLEAAGAIVDFRANTIHMLIVRQPPERKAKKKSR